MTQSEPEDDGCYAYAGEEVVGAAALSGVNATPALELSEHVFRFCDAVALELSFDSRLIYDRPYLLNLFSPKFIEYILGKGNSLPV